MPTENQPKDSKSIRIPGSRINRKVEQNISTLGTEMIILDEIEVSKFRGIADEIELDCQETDTINIEFEDGSEWLGSAFDIDEIFAKGQVKSGQKRGNAAEGMFNFPTKLDSSNERGVFDLPLKFIRRITGKKVDKFVGIIAERFDRKIVPQPGIFHVNSEFKLIPNIDLKKQSAPYLLLIHGNASSTAGSFSDIYNHKENNLWESIWKQYGERVIALEHHTISKSPIDNAITAISALPPESEIHILSFSRGGIIADLLARCSFNEEENIYGFAEDEIDILQKDIKAWKDRYANNDNSDELIKELNALAKEKKISVSKVIRVASPSRGTTLLSKRLDHYLNGLLWCVGKAVGDKLNPIYVALKELITQVVSNKQNAEQLPGFCAMIPNSPLQRFLNNPAKKIDGDLLIIEGNAEFGGGVKQSVLVILSNLFYLKANDFVVDTDSMRYGVLRENPIYFALSEDSKTHHFNYFKNTNTQLAIRNAIQWHGEGLPSGFLLYTDSREDRGITRILDFRPLRPVEIVGNKPVVILVPGNLASHLYNGSEVVWTNFGALLKGNLTKYASDNNLKAEAIFKSFYGDLVKYLQQDGFDVVIMPYDWRKSVTEGGKKLEKILEDYKEHNHPVKIVAHSMGGLVVRDVMMRNQPLWKEIQNKEGFKLIMMGTPWRGSYVAVSALFGMSKMINKIVFADFCNSRLTVINALQSFYGIYQLLPIDDEKIEKYSGYWERLYNYASQSDLILPKETLIEKFREFKKEVNDFKIENTDNIYYIKGNRRTVYKAQYEESSLGVSLGFPKGENVNGDGVVTWKLGIPAELPQSQILHVDSAHNFLTDDKGNFPKILRVLNSGLNRDGSQEDINQYFENVPPVDKARRGEKDHNNLLESIFDIEQEAQAQGRFETPLNVSVTHGNLMASKYPVMVGHFEGDGIVSAEGALNRALNNKLEERRLFGTYPQAIGDNFTLYDEDHNPAGAIIVGLGQKDELTETTLALTVEKGIINYALHHRDNKLTTNTLGLNRIVSLCIGSGYGGLQMTSSLTAIIRGISVANQKLQIIDEGKYVVKHVEFIDYYEDMARYAFKELMQIEENNFNFNIEVVGKIKGGSGGMRRLIFQKDQNWWHTFTTQSTGNQNIDREVGLKFMSSSGIAKVEATKSNASLSLVRKLIERFSLDHKFNQETSKTLFEMLVPSSLKDIIRSEKDLIWKLDEHSAEYPWELLYDWKVSEAPTFTNAGLIRQLIDNAGVVSYELSTSDQALVIGDPIYHGLPQLQGALEEAKSVTDKLDDYFRVTALYNETAEVISNALYNREYKILHIAGHGIYQKKGENQRERIGIVLEDGELTSGDIAQLPVIPEFVFINCCHLGKIDSMYESYYQDRHKLAANIGTQLIKMGVKAIVVAAWAVDDSAAKTFANVLYDNMLAGAYFGDAVKIARKKCFELHPHTSTWGAYQCYGSPWYKMKYGKSNNRTDQPYISEEEAMVDLENLHASCTNLTKSDQEWAQERLANFSKRAKVAGFGNNAIIVELEASIFNRLGEVKKSLGRYIDLFKINQASYSVTSLEQYCNLLVKDFMIDGADDDIRKDFILDQFKALMIIGKTSERLALFGSAYKRFAQSFVKERFAYLQQMESNYHDAYRLLEESEPRKYCYAFTNYLIAHYYTNARSRDIIYKGEKIQPATVLTEMEDTFNNENIWRQSTNFMEKISDINVWTVQMLYSTDPAVTRSKRDVIIKSYKELWQNEGTKRQLNSEIEHFQFLVEMNSTKNSKRKEKVRIPNKGVRDAVKEVLDGLMAMD